MNQASFLSHDTPHPIKKYLTVFRSGPLVIFYFSHCIISQN